MGDLPDREAMARLDRVAVRDVGLPLLSMMENAGRELARVTGETPGRVAVLAGKGNNGGGGLVAARHLANRGRDVAWASPYPADATTDPNAAHRRVLEASGLPARDEVPDADVYVDALLGYNARGPPRPLLDAWIAQINEADTWTVSLDLPSGLDATTGETPGACVRADVTATLASVKCGLRTREGPEVAGDVCLLDIGIPASAYRKAGLDRPTTWGVEPW